METEAAIHRHLPTAPSLTTNLSHAPSLSGTHGSIYPTSRSPINAGFIPPPPPPPLGTRANHHSRHNSRTEAAGNHFPLNNPSHAYTSHSRTHSAASWVPPPPPPPLAIPQSDGPGYQPPSSTFESALQLTLSPPGQSPVQLRNGVTSSPSANSTESQHIRNRSVPGSTYDPNIPSHPNSLHGPFNYMPAVASQYTPSHSHTNSSPFYLSSNQPNINAPHLPARHSPHHFPPHRHSYTFPSQVHAAANHPPGTASTNMLLTRASTTFERGPFPASSIPPHHTHRPSHLGPSPPPPPRPPKPPELQVEAPSNTLPTVPQRINVAHQQGQSVPSIHRDARTAPERTPVDVGADQSPEPQALHEAADVVNRGGQSREDVGASIADTGDKVPGHLPAGQAYRIIDQANEGLLRHPDGDSLSDTPAATVPSTSHPEFAAETTAQRGASTGIQGIGRATPDDAGYDGARGTNVTSEDQEEVRSESGMTMDNYDPTVFDFPRRVNDAMTHVLSPVVENVVSTPITPTAPAVHATDAEGEAPPTYDQVELESQLTQVSSPQVENANMNTIHSPMACYPAPAFPPPTRQTMSPPPAFRPETPPAVGGSTQAHPTQRHNLPFHPPEKRARPLPPVEHGPTRAPSNSSSSGHGHDGLVMSSRGAGPSRSPTRPVSQPAIYTSPPTPSPRGSPTNLRSLRISLPRRRNTADVESPPSRSPTSESSDPFLDPPTFQADASPFALSHDTGQNTNDSPRSAPTEARSHSPISESAPRDGTGSNAWNTRSRSYSGFWSNVSSTPPTPRSEVSVHELGRRHPEEAVASTSVSNGEKSKRRLTKGGGSRMSAFFRPGSSHGSLSPQEMSARHSQPPVPRPVRAGGVDLLDDGTLGDRWEDAHGQARSPVGDGGDASHAQNEGTSPADEGEQSILMDLWDGIEYGFGAPGWNIPPAPGPYSNPAEWPEGITLYPVGSKPFFIRAPTWRSLLRFLASQSTLRIEPSVEALATSRTPTMDLRLVVQFARTPYTPRGTTRDVCLYMMLHTEMPARTTRAGRAMSLIERDALESWNTRVLPYGFMCAERGLLARHGVTAMPDVTAGATDLKGTRTRDQDPDGEDSMFITIPPPFIELPVKMSDIALYLHECLVLSRKNGKKSDRPKTAPHPPSAQQKLRKGNGSNIHLPDGAQPSSRITMSGVQVSTPASTVQGNGSTSGPSSIHNPALADVPGLKRLAKAVKTFYPDEYAIGSSKANQAAESAAVEEDLNRGKIMNVSRPEKGKGMSSGKSSGFLSAFQRVRSKSAAAKQTVTTAGGLGRGGRDTNAERFELVTPWRE